MEPKTKAEPPRESGYGKRLSYFILAFVIVAVVPLYIYREAVVLRAIADDPMSRIILFGEPLDPRELARHLNEDGEPIYMANVIADTNDSCSSTAAAPFPKGKMTAVTFNVQGVERHGVVYVPSSYPASAGGTVQAASMLVLFHGLNDNCEHFLNATDFLPYAEQYGLVLVSACGSQGYLGTAWNSGTCCGFSDDKPDDVGFAQQIVRDMRQAVCVNERKVMAVGFSNGAMLTEVLACEAPDVFQAAISIGGVVELRPGNAEGLQLCTQKVQAKAHRSSVLMVHGTSDVMVPWAGNRLLGFPSAEANVAGWVQRNGCVANATNSTIHTSTYTNTIYGSCDAAKATSGLQTGRWWVDRVQGLQQHRPLELWRSNAVFDVAADAAAASPQAVVETLGGKPHQRGRPAPAEEDDDNDEEKEEENGENEDDQPPRHPKHGPHDHHHPHRHPKHDPHDHDHPPRHPNHGPHRKGGKMPRRPDPCPMPPVVVPEATVYEDSATSEVELVKVEGGGHRWPEDDEFSTTDYIIEFGARVFRGYGA